jgi:hypothetical protein
MRIIQFFLWVMVVYFAIRVIRSFLTIRKRSHRHREDAPYVDIEDADFEDLTEKPEDKKDDKTSESS